jgi:hypothetical protein
VGLPVVNIAPSTYRRLFWALTAAAAAGVSLCVYAAVWMAPTDGLAAMEAAARSRRPVVDTREPPPKALPLTAYAAIWKRNLRQPLVDVAAEPTAKAALKLVLLGTAVSPGKSEAMFRDGAGQMHWAGVGQVVGGAKVTAIQEGSATVEFNGAPVTLTVTRGQPSP